MQEIARRAVIAIGFSWRSLFITDLFYKAVSFALLTPGTLLVIRWMLNRAGTKMVADADIATFFFTTPEGILALLLGGAILTAITAVESACLMAIGIAATQSIRITARKALALGAANAISAIRLSGHMIVRLLIGLLPFAIAGGAVYFLLLRAHDINYYLTTKPTEFWIAAVLMAVIVAVLLVLLLRTIARWSLALPLILFEGVHPRRSLGESARRVAGRYRITLLVLATWAIIALALNSLLTLLMEVTGRGMAPGLGDSLPTLLVFIGSLAFFWIALGLLVAIFNVSLFSVLIVILYLNSGATKSAEAIAAAELEQANTIRRSPAMLAAVIAIVVIVAGAFSLLAFLQSGNNSDVLVIAHRGSSIGAPENTLAAFKLAVKEQADFIELDVQESRDGNVVVIHDSDLMKIGRSPMKIWDHTLAELQSVDIGSYLDPQFHAERVPTLAEALAASKGSRVLVEFKSYGHNDRLEERVAEIVEKAGMVQDCMFMSLDHSMSLKMKQLRPNWRVGVLAAKVVGDITSLKADFVAVEARMATRRFVRKAHRAGQDVYVWTVDDPAWMLAAMNNGVDGLITNKPALARTVIAKRSQMNQVQRILVALLVRLGASTASLEAETSLRP